MSKMTGDGKGGKMGLKGHPDRVRQSFSHGRTKSVVVETKKKFVLQQKPGATTAADIRAGLAAKAAQARAAEAPAEPAADVATEATARSSAQAAARAGQSPGHAEGGTDVLEARAEAVTETAPAQTTQSQTDTVETNPVADPAAEDLAARRGTAAETLPSEASPKTRTAPPAEASPVDTTQAEPTEAELGAGADTADTQAVEPSHAAAPAAEPEPAADATAASQTPAPAAIDPAAATAVAASAATDADAATPAQRSTEGHSQPPQDAATPAQDASPTNRPAPAQARTTSPQPTSPSQPSRDRQGRQAQRGQPQGRNQRGGKPGAGGKTLSSEEIARRRKALEAAQATEQDRRRRQVEDERRRVAELEQLREARAREEREAREREDARKREIEAQKALEEAERKKAEEEKARAEARAARQSRTQATATPAEPAAPPADKPQRAPAGRREREANERANKAKTGDSRRSSGKLTINQALTGGEEGGRQRSMAAMRRRQERERRKMGGAQEPREKVVREVKLPDAITVQELANRMAERVADVVKFLMGNGIMATMNQTIDAETAELVIADFGHKVLRVSESDVEDAIETAEDSDDQLEPRAPVVTVMGHVDHGKTSLLDAIRHANVVSGEAGGITQHIGAYQVTTGEGRVVTFLDTPGHAAFTSMRARGAQVTDIVILVVAADDSVMPQTIEAISHAKAAEVPMIVAINKCDKPEADPQRVRVELLQHEVVVEDMSGDVLDIEVSAVTRQGIDDLLENVALQAELLELRANPDRSAEGAVIEAKLDTGRGPVATVLVQRGTLKRGDVFVVGEQWGKVRALISDQGERVNEAGPSVPVEVLGLNGTPEAGDTLNVVETEAKAREIADYRQRLAKEKQAAAGARASLDQLLAQAKADADVRELPVV
ncbi:MAG: translation initiation factor IF-2, partial [Pseudomonadota bacterium]